MTNPGRTRVAHVLPNLLVGGQEMFVAQLARALAGPSIEPLVIALTGAGPIGDRLADWGISSHVLEPRRHVPGWPASLIAELRGLRVDLLHSHSGSWFPAALAGRVRGLPVVHTEHGRYPNEPTWVRWADRLAAGWTDRLIVVSPSLADDMRRRLGPSAKPHFIPNGVPLPAPLSPARFSELRGAVGCPDGAVVVGTVGRLVEAKDHATFLRALTVVRAGCDRAHGVIVGDGPLHSYLMEEATRLGLVPHITLAGYRSDAAELAATFDVYVSSSTTEGMPIAVLEAMAASRAIAATAVGGVVELLDGGAAGVLVPAGDAAALGRGILGLIVAEAERGRVGARARMRVEQHYGMAACARRYADVYHAVLRATPPRRVIAATP